MGAMQFRSGKVSPEPCCVRIAMILAMSLVPRQSDKRPSKEGKFPNLVREILNVGLKR